MNPSILRNYLKFRQHSPFMLQGSNALLAMRAAHTLAEWDKLEANGRVRLETSPDEDCRKDWDCDRHCTDEHPCTACRLFASDGAWQVVGEWRLSDDDEWESADSICGCVGYADPGSAFENCYVIDIMQATLDAYHAARAASFGDVMIEA